MEKSLSPEEFEALSKEINDILIKHNAVMSVKSSIELTKVEDEETKPTTEESGVGSNGKSS